MLRLIISQSYIPAQCRDIFGVAGLADAGASMYNTAANNSTNYQIAMMNNRMQQDIARENNEMQREQASLNRDFTANQADLARQHDFELQAKQMQYDSPIEQMKRFREAGLNPYAMMSGQSAIGASVPNSGVSPQAPGSGLTPSMPIFDVPRMEKFASILPGILESINRMADAKKTGQETRVQQQMENLVGEQVVGAQIQNDINRSYGKLLADANLRNVIQDTHLKAQQIQKAISDGNLADATKLLNEEKARTEKITQSLYGEIRKQYENSNKIFFDKFEKDIEEANSRIASNNANARLSSEQAARIKQLVPLEKNQMRKQTGLYATQLLQAWEDYTNSKLTPEQKRLLHDKVTEELETALNDNSSTWWNPVQAVAWTISPLARQIGIALGGSASAGFNKVSKPK